MFCVTDDLHCWKPRESQVHLHNARIVCTELLISLSSQCLATLGLNARSIFWAAFMLEQLLWWEQLYMCSQKWVSVEPPSGPRLVHGEERLGVSRSWHNVGGRMLWEHHLLRCPTLKFNGSFSVYSFSCSKMEWSYTVCWIGNRLYRP